MDNFIFSPNKDNDQYHNEFYCLIGKEDFLDSNNSPRCNDEDNKHICAKKIIRADNTVKYMIKTDHDRKLYNPLFIYGNKEFKNFLTSIARNQNSFKEVNYTSFSLYIKFLKTKNIAYLNNAERET